MATDPNIYLTAIGASISAPRVSEELERQRHLTKEQRDRIQVLEVKEEMKDWTELSRGSELIDEGNMPGFSGAWLDLCQIEKESRIGDKFRKVPQLCIFDVSGAHTLRRSGWLTDCRHFSTAYHPSTGR